MKNEYEGGLYLSVGTIQMGDSIMVHRCLYTVLDGVVCEIKCGKVTPTGDELSQVTTLEKVGEYDPGKTYADSLAQTLTIKQFCEAMERA